MMCMCVCSILGIVHFDLIRSPTFMSMMAGMSKTKRAYCEDYIRYGFTSYSTKRVVKGLCVLCLNVLGNDSITLSAPSRFSVEKFFFNKFYSYFSFYAGEISLETFYLENRLNFFTEP